MPGFVFLWVEGFGWVLFLKLGLDQVEVEKNFNPDPTHVVN